MSLIQSHVLEYCDVERLYHRHFLYIKMVTFQVLSGYTKGLYQSHNFTVFISTMLDAFEFAGSYHNATQFVSMFFKLQQYTIPTWPTHRQVYFM